MPVLGMQTPYPIAKTTSGQAISAIILGIASLLVVWYWSAFYGFGMAVIGIILAATAMSKFDPTTQKGKGLAIAGLVSSICTILLFLWYLFY
jgi:bacteriorhodopsin